MGGRVVNRPPLCAVLDASVGRAGDGSAARAAGAGALAGRDDTD